MRILRRFFFQIIIILAFLFNGKKAFSQCDFTTPSFVVDLSLQPDSVWIETNTARLDSCCFKQDPQDDCIMFVVTLAPSIGALYFSVESPQPSISASQFHINCDSTEFSVQDTVCIEGFTPPYTITYCKPGNDKPDYIIAGIGAGEISPPIVVSDACTDTITATGFVESTLVWNSVYPGSYGAYNYFLSDSLAEDTVIVTPTGNYPDSVQYEVCGDLSGFSCSSGAINKCDSTWVYFVSSFFVNISPQNPSICAAGDSVTLTANASGGALPYTYLWSTGDTTQSIIVISGNSGDYWVQVKDTLECAGVFDTVTVVEFIVPISVNAGSDDTICTDNPFVNLNGSVTGVSTGTWSGGNGTFSPSADSLITTYTPDSAELATGTFTLILTTTNTGSCPADSDSIVVTVVVAPSADAGPDQNGCFGPLGVQLNGIVSNTSGGVWTTLGSGTFSPDSATLNASYLPSATDISAGTVTLILTATGSIVCSPVTDTAVMTILPAPAVNAGVSISVCATNPNVTLNGSVTIVPGATWTSSGTGTFSPNNTTLIVNYIPSAADILAGNVIITLTSDSLGVCVAVDTIVITYTPDLITADAGADITVCKNSSGVQLAGTVGVATGGIWTTSGGGTFSPSADSLNTVYMPSPADTLAGSVTLTLTTTGNGGCGAKTDTLTITFIPADFVSVSSDTTVCNDVDSIPVSGIFTNAAGAVWSTSGTGTFSPNDSTLNAQYTPSAADILNGMVNLILTTYGGCSNASDTITFTILPFVNAGPDQIACVADTSISLSGMVTGAIGGVWTTTGTGTFSPNDTTLNADYIISPADSAAGAFTLILTTTGNVMGCPSAFDSLNVTFLPVPSVDAGINQTVCANNANVSLSGTVDTNAVGGVVWTSSGTGVFTPDSVSLNAIYIPSNADTAVGTVTLILTTFGSCVIVADSITVVITDAPVVDAGVDAFVCSTNPNVILNGSIAVATGGIWTTSGTGTFSPNNTDLNATYTPSNADTAAGSVMITLTSTGNGNCLAALDTMLITITSDAIAVDAGNDTTVCAGIISLNGTISIASGGIWSALGSGTFSPSNILLSTDYIFSNADTAAGSVMLILTTTGNGGCAAKSDTIVVSIQGALSINISAPSSACAGAGAVPVSATVSTGQGTWSTLGDGTFTPNNTSLNPLYIPGSGDFTANNVTLVFTSTNTGACAPVSDSATVILIPSPIPDFNYAGVCPNDTTAFSDATTTVGNIVSWDWDFGDGNTDTVQNPTNIYPTNGNYNVTLVVVSNNGCVNSITQTITIQPLPTAGFVSSAQCFVDSVYFTDISTTGNGIITGWNWDFGDSDTSSAQNPSHFYFSPGSYNVTLIAMSSFGCLDTITQAITVQPAPNAAFGNNSVCLNETTIFTDSSTTSFGNVISWQWDFGDGNTSTSQNPTNTYLSDGTHNVQLIVSSDNGCSDTLIQTIVIYPLPVANYGDSGHCENQAIYFYDSSIVSADSIISWQWIFGDGGMSTDINPTHIYFPAGSYGLTLVVESNYGCFDTLNEVITIDPTPLADFTVLTPIVNLDITSEFEDNSTGANSWYWDFGDALGISTAQNPTHQYNLAATYVVTEIVTNLFGCMDTAYGEVIVTLPPQIPNGFTPNGDGQNDILFPLGGPYVSLEFKIWNNWGELIFVSNRQDYGWNGTREGTQQPVGVYVYMLIATTEDNVEHQLHGDVTLLR